MKKVSIWLIMLSILLTACVQGSPSEQLQNMQQTTAAQTTSSSMTVVMTTVPTSTQNNVITTEPITAPRSQPKTSTSKPTVAPTTATTTREQSTTVQQTPTRSQPMSVSFVHAYTLEKYYQFINNNDLPGWFVTYDQLAHIGSFEGFVLRSDASRGQYHAYYYSLKTPSGENVSIEIYYRFGKNDSELKSDGTNYGEMHTGDLRKIDYQEKGFIWVDEVLYSYRGGNLRSIKWKDEDNLYHLFVDSDISIQEQSAFIKNILHTDTVKTAMQSFKASMEAAAVK